MGIVSLPSLDTILQIKDPDKRFEELVNTMGILIKNLSEINGYLTAKNIRANSIETRNLKAGAVTADKIDVNELSAISANLGHIIAGLIETVTMIGSEIYGSYIATSQAGYPRAEMSNTSNLFKASANPTQSVGVEAFTSTGAPGISWTDGSDDASATLDGGLLEMSSETDMKFGSLGNITLQSSGNIEMTPLGVVLFLSWANIYNSGAGQTLQQALNSKANVFFGFSGSFSTGDGRTASFSNGICTSVI